MTDDLAPLDERIRGALRAEAGPVGRQLAEVRGLSSRSIRHLERIEGTLAAERAARVDDLAVLVDLVSSGWRSVDERLKRIEEALAARIDTVPVELIGELLGGDEQDALPERRADAA